VSFDYRFTCPLPCGMHARPATAFEEVARRFVSDISLVNQRTGQAANAKSVLGIVSLDIRQGDACRVFTIGADERWAIEAVKAFVDTELGHVDDALPAPPSAPGSVVLPRMLQQANVRVLPGIPVAPGIGRGRAVSVTGFTLPDSVPRTDVADPEAEMQRLGEALRELARGYDTRLENQRRGVEADVLRAHRAVARDPEFQQHLFQEVRDHRLTAAGAITATESHFSEMLVATGSALLRERALDIRDVCHQLLRVVYGDVVQEHRVELSVPSVCLADALTPGEFLALDRGWLKGLVLAHGGTTSHTVILARTFGVPTLVGVRGLDASLDGREVVVDADLGVLVTTITEDGRLYYDMEHRRLDARRARVRRFADAPAATTDGRRIEIGANVGSADEVSDAVAAGADGIGLFRTEMLFLDRTQPPTEDEQFEEYRRALADADGRPVIVRTFDVGGDKPLPYLSLPREDNPFLGYRAVRIYPEFSALFRTQVRALVRASAFGRLRVMVPMVARLEEAVWVKDVVAEEQARMAADGLAIDRSMELGAMIEVPSAAFLVGPLSRHLDFFSIGTNDLLQYFVAADRANGKLADLSNPLAPAFLRLLDLVVREARARGRWIGLCGEMGGQANCLPVLVGLGLDEISMATPLIAATKATLAELSQAGCRALLEQAAACGTPHEVEPLLDAPGHRRDVPLIDPALVVVRGTCRTKEEAVKTGVDLLFASGRTDRPREVEEAVWQREATYSTGFGHGFAIPHCRTDAVTANSLAVVTLDEGVEWGSLDGKPVRVMILLAIRQSATATAHMRVLATLARRAMHEEFRDGLSSAPDAESLCRFLSESLNE
jgi:fructose-specific PTS system IIA-like component